MIYKLTTADETKSIKLRASRVVSAALVECSYNATRPRQFGRTERGIASQSNANVRAVAAHASLGAGGTVSPSDAPKGEGVSGFRQLTVGDGEWLSALLDRHGGNAEHAA
jgi:hypothetical protein